MKKLKYFIVAMMLLSSCDDELEMTNPNQRTTSTYWATEDQAFAGVVAVYNALTTDGTYQRTFPSFSDSRGDDMYGDSPATYLELGGQFAIPNNAGEVQWIWRDHYMVVFRANQVIENVAKMDAAVISEDARNRILGQAYFLRGLAYYNLAITYKAVPLITVPPADKTEYYPATASEQELWNHIYSDLRLAEEKLPVSYDNVVGPDRGQKGRATKGAAAGMLGKAYLYRKMYPEAETQFAKFFTGPLQGVYSLVPNYRDNFTTTNENNAESLFEVQFSATGGSIPNWTGEPTATWRQFIALPVAYGMDGKGWSDYQPTRWIFNEYRQEKTKDGKTDPRLAATILFYDQAEGFTSAYGTPWPADRRNQIYPRKYTMEGLGVPIETPETGGVNYRVLRYADILLMYAEVLNELNRTSDAYSYIQQVRNRANLPDLSTVKPGLSQAQMRDQIAHERALEFAIEGQRIQDIIRWGWLYDPAKLVMLKEHDDDFNTWTPGNEYLPIPQTELDYNSNLLPNSAN
ncbi:RagB/SusD family nutrient uptake outer membrane protein [Rufibacter sp. XAAS-G3-1]|uniref:RagB/SusD family nutrient uptake outer membrane protein n=1 Tax=Rufibacter sp. XAAS-G3-1 TaxID=2729134 RepID=UPI001C6316E6|nr:RagB/SusD family nutrient uptake outer membrane protein [Rufibacter sp. XAAS-G3-1]